MSTTLRFASNGRIDCLYTEAIDLRCLGRLAVVRATDIRFVPDTQQWEVRDASSEERLFAHASRTRCLQWEHDNLQPGSSG